MIEKIIEANTGKNTSEKSFEDNTLPDWKNNKAGKDETNDKKQEYSDPVRRTNLMSGVLEVLADGYGFLRSDNYQSGENDVYVKQIKNSDCYKQGFIEFVKELKANKPSVSIDELLKSVYFIAALIESVETGKEVRIK